MSSGYENVSRHKALKNLPIGRIPWVMVKIHTLNKLKLLNYKLQRGKPDFETLKSAWTGISGFGPLIPSLKSLVISIWKASWVFFCLNEFKEAKTLSNKKDSYHDYNKTIEFVGLLYQRWPKILKKVWVCKWEWKWDQQKTSEPCGWM